MYIICTILLRGAYGRRCLLECGGVHYLASDSGLVLANDRHRDETVVYQDLRMHHLSGHIKDCYIISTFGSPCRNTAGIFATAFLDIQMKHRRLNLQNDMMGEN
jgi:hypothetical protein